VHEPQVYIDRLKGKKRFCFLDAFPSEINCQCLRRVVYKYVVYHVKGRKNNVCFRRTLARRAYIYPIPILGYPGLLCENIKKDV